MKKEASNVFKANSLNNNQSSECRSYWPFNMEKAKIRNKQRQINQKERETIRCKGR